MWIKFCFKAEGVASLPKRTLNYSGHQWRTLNIDTFIYSWGILEKRTSQPGTHHNGYRERHFPPRVFLVTMRAAEANPLTPEPTDGILGKLAKARSSKNSYQSQLSQFFICGAWSKQEVKISHCPFLSKFRLSGKERGYQSFLSPRQLLPPCLSHLCPENLAWKLSGWRGEGRKAQQSPKYGWTEMWVVLHLQL